MRRPLLSVAVFYTAGILVGEFCGGALFWLLGACLLAGMGAILWRRGRFVLLPVFLLSLGWSNLVWRTAIFSPSDLRVVLGDKPALASIRGRLTTAPAGRIFERRHEEMMRTVAYVDVATLGRGNDWEVARGQVMVMTPGALGEDFYNGQNVEVSGVILEPNGPIADGLFDGKAFLKRKGIYYQLRAGSTNDWHVFGTPARRPLSDRFFSYAKRTLAIGSPEEDLPLRLMWTLVLDWKAPMTAAVEEPFVRAGTLNKFGM